jgi:anthraniloyl-CoA monooxygenase
MRPGAFESLRWFENIGSYDSLSLVDLAMSCMLRSGRVNYVDLRERDPNFVARFEAETKTR